MESNRKILIVDDDVDFVRIHKTMLERNGCEVETAATSVEGLEKAREAKPDAIILDFVMETPTAGGPVAQQLSEDAALKDIPIIMVTAVRKLKPWLKGFEPNVDWLPVRKVLDKPVTSEQLVAALNEVLPG
ncbi:MAG: response regulator [Chloroflexota bacterium]